ncbi:MAG: hypothetical protein MJB57_17675, partial [Gemmatimonadetes bacterium]|nr:hypothetical protein [Gemmatimonadota bacterium]
LSELCFLARSRENLRMNRILHLTADEMREVDRAMIDDLRIELTELYAGSGLAYDVPPIFAEHEVIRL